MPQLAGVCSIKEFVLWLVIFYVRNLVEDVMFCRFVKLIVPFQHCLQLLKAYNEVIQRRPGVWVSDQNETQIVDNRGIVV